jgi:hypothetical protein
MDLALGARPAESVAMATVVRTGSPVVAGDALLHPVAIAAVVLLVLNDHVLKGAYPGPITGKVSDFAGLVFFPLALQAAWEFAWFRTATTRLASDRVLLTACVATGVVFTAAKTLPAANTAVSLALSNLQHWLWSLPGSVPVALDPTDLVALPALIVAFALGHQRGVAAGR